MPRAPWTQEELDLLVAGPVGWKVRSGATTHRDDDRNGARAGELRGLQLGDFDLYRNPFLARVLELGQTERSGADAMTRLARRTACVYPTSTTSTAVAIQNATPRAPTHTATSNDRRRSAGISWLVPKTTAGQSMAAHHSRLSNDPAYPSQRSASRVPDASSPDEHAQPDSRAGIVDMPIATTTTAAPAQPTGADAAKRSTKAGEPWSGCG